MLEEEDITLLEKCIVGQCGQQKLEMDGHVLKEFKSTHPITANFINMDHFQKKSTIENNRRNYLIHHEINREKDI